MAVCLWLVVVVSVGGFFLRSLVFGMQYQGIARMYLAIVKNWYVFVVNLGCEKDGIRLGLVTAMNIAF